MFLRSGFEGFLGGLVVAFVRAEFFLYFGFFEALETKRNQNFELRNQKANQIIVKGFMEGESKE
jgi:hypothetical protein